MGADPSRPLTHNYQVKWNWLLLEQGFTSFYHHHSLLVVLSAVKISLCDPNPAHVLNGSFAAKVESATEFSLFWNHKRCILYNICAPPPQSQVLSNLSHLCGKKRCSGVLRSSDFFPCVLSNLSHPGSGGKRTLFCVLRKWLFSRVYRMITR